MDIVKMILKYYVPDLLYYSGVMMRLNFGLSN
ncbi:hypothetical protein BOSEA31B_10643 [Hyphomicrobiales bacterium]|nr:hypothetical protein BOSEA31B_10643 [Hyphomicrobiales bacterium]CAH1700495.1 hypothetical protein BOSEA1005_20194 [Hyphomicrobiales bacterium]CAI0344345.1 hypothetical protein BO1005MUT1_330012 [Hyphomicrobiales bacterium]